MALIFYPFIVLSFWYKDALIGILKRYRDLNVYILNLLSFSLLFKTFFKPLKNEYRAGLVGFSIGMGMFIKTILIFADLIILIFFLIVEIIGLVAFLVAPFAGFYLLFI